MSLSTHVPASYEVGPLDRALDILERLAVGEEMSLVELSAATALSKTTAFRHLRVLERRGYVEQDQLTKRYRLAYGVLNLGYHARRSLQLPKVADPWLRELATEFNETVHLGAMAGHEVVHIAVVPSRHVLTMASEVGERTYVHVSSMGKCLIAWDDPATVDALLAPIGLPRLTPRTIVDRPALDVELQRVRSQGYAVDDEESLDRLRCVGAPVRSAGGTVVAAISISGPIDRVDDTVLPQMARRVVETAEAISRKCGWSESKGRG
jgi:DNA-binding IclR family transcriptional regulator